MSSEIVPGLAGVPVAKSAISFVDGQNGVLEYRGIPIQELATKAIFPEVMYLLLENKLPDHDTLEKWKKLLAKHQKLAPEVMATLKALPRDGHPMNALVAGVAAMGMVHAKQDAEAEDPGAMAIVRILAQMPTMIAAVHRLRNGQEPVEPRNDIPYVSNFLYMLEGEEPDVLKRRIMDRCLTLHADHSFNASTFASRVTGSAEASVYLVFCSGIATLSGPLHGGANEAVLKQLAEIGSVDNVRPWFNKAREDKRKIMGLGHRVYKVKDPRAFALQGLVPELFKVHGASKLYDIAVELEKVAEEELASKGIYPNVDFYSGLVYEKLGIQPELFTPMFVFGRAPGWLAHWREQMRENRIYRPKQVYIGQHDQPYTEIKERDASGGSVWMDLA